VIVWGLWRPVLPARSLSVLGRGLCHPDALTVRTSVIAPPWRCDLNKVGQAEDFVPAQREIASMPVAIAIR
jgi:hypothetical protein